MRLILCALLALMLSACAGTANMANGSDGYTNAYATNQDQGKETAQSKALRRASASKTIDVDHSSVDSLASNDTDLWGRIRRGFQIPDLSGDLVDSQTNWYVTRPDYVQRMTDRSRLYLYHIVEQLEARHMPTELALLPFIESAYNPQALSVAKAAGMWQFIPGTGRDYNLAQNMFQDQRRDVLASTDAALDYLSRLHDMFGDWQLALAAYNWGEGNVQKAIARNAAKGLPTDYASLNMPNETRNYVPKLQAVKNLIADPAKYGLTLPEIPNHPYFVTVTTSRDIDVKVAAQLADMKLDDFKALNPSFTKPVILGSTQPQILLPFDSAEVFARNLKHYSLPLSSWTTYQVSARERPKDLAEKIGVDPKLLMAVNKIPSGMRLKPGSTILVPKSDDGPAVGDISATVAENAVLSIEPDQPIYRRVSVRVPQRESVTSLASRLGVSVSELRRWNRTRAASVRAGTQLVVYVREDVDGGARPVKLETVSLRDDDDSRGRVIRASDRVDAPAPEEKPATRTTRRAATTARARTESRSAKAESRPAMREVARETKHETKTVASSRRAVPEKRVAKSEKAAPKVAAKPAAKTEKSAGKSTTRRVASR
ncbi:transglycosylase SLT domain-containing protein [Robbsia sp. KACC 23696]|uniref:transglycosylase SLT domain-containing protein n=1 Tax=Robbsia sp. KACC 23696 TaxID=3149231 RepID=UPI00325B3A0A